MTPLSVGHSVLWGTIEGIAFVGAAAILSKGVAAFAPAIKTGRIQRKLARTFSLVEPIGPPLATNGFKYLSEQFVLSTRVGKFTISSGHKPNGDITGALKHLVQEEINKTGLSYAATTELSEALVIEELKVVLEQAVASAIKYNEKMIINIQGRSYEIIIDIPRVSDQIGRLFHLREL